MQYDFDHFLLTSFCFRAFWSWIHRHLSVDWILTLAKTQWRQQQQHSRKKTCSIIYLCNANHTNDNWCFVDASFPLLTTRVCQVHFVVVEENNFFFHLFVHSFDRSVPFGFIIFSQLTKRKTTKLSHLLPPFMMVHLVVAGFVFSKRVKYCDEYSNKMTTVW